MRKLRVICVLLFLISCVFTGLYAVKTMVFVDNKAPEITCEEDTITVSVTEDVNEALMKGVKAKDNKDGDLTDAVRVSSLSYFTGNTRIVKYVVFDKANNAAELERTVQYSDYVSPRIYTKKAFRYDVQEIRSGSTVLSHLTAQDCLEGDLTNDIKMGVEGGVYIESAGVYPVTFQVSNVARDVCAVSVEVEVVDSSDETERGKEYPTLSDYILYTSVGIPLDLGATITGVEINGREYTLGEYQALYGGMASVEIEAGVNYSEPGTYVVKYWTTAGKQGVTKQYVVVEGE